MIVYHFTSRDGYQSITSTGQFAASGPLTTMDAAYGTGWYFTDKDPSTCEYTLMFICWGRTDVRDRVTNFLKFDIPDWLLTKCRDSVFMLKEWSTLAKYLGGGPTSKCTLKPCSKCVVYQKYYMGK